MERSELFIVEGDSALGTAKLARNSEFQALLPIRGKILNVQKASVGDMLKNAECASIIQVVGAGSGPHLRHRRRAATAGSSSWPTPTPTARTSAACCATLFFKYMPDLITEGRVYTRRAAAAPDRAVQPEEGHGQVRLHLLRRRAAADSWPS